MTRRDQFRFINNKGDYNIIRKGVEGGGFSDAYHWVLTAQWRWVIVSVVGYYVGLNALFGALFMAGGDCVDGATPGRFLDYFSFSVQTMSSIGYGVMSPKTDYAHMLVTVEALISLVSVAMGTGIMFAKFARPSARVVFCEKAIITPYNGTPTLMMRAANMRANRVVDAHVHVHLVLFETSLEGEEMRRIYDLELTRSRTSMFALSWTIFHPIDEDSPLYGFPLEEWEDAVTEITVSISGIDGTFNQTIFARHSYTSEDVVENARFVDVIYPQEDGSIMVDYTHFHEVERL